VHCLALGADRALLLIDRALAGSDTLATARALALLLAKEKPDLILCGRNSTDAETGQVGPEITKLLGFDGREALDRYIRESPADIQAANLLDLFTQLPQFMAHDHVDQSG
jgi:electron transfer flavoprotein alpha/beta subunit